MTNYVLLSTNFVIEVVKYRVVRGFNNLDFGVIFRVLSAIFLSTFDFQNVQNKNDIQESDF